MIVLAGDSHLARVRRDLVRIGPDVVNVAVGGSVARDVAGQLAEVDIDAGTVVVVSVGTNDAAPWRQEPLSRFVRALRDVAAEWAGRCPLVYVASPGCDPGRMGLRPGDRTPEVMAAYSAAAGSLVREAGGVVVDTPSLLAPLGTAAFSADGVHLTGAAYDVLLPALTVAVDASRSPDPG